MVHLIQLEQEGPQQQERPQQKVVLYICHKRHFRDRPKKARAVLLPIFCEILQLLGEGGMGAVYCARDREVNRMVALKVIRPELTGNSDILNRFKQELVLSHQVTHKNVVRIYDFLGLAVRDRRPDEHSA